jgi:hypothetical protein
LVTGLGLRLGSGEIRVGGVAGDTPGVPTGSDTWDMAPVAAVSIDTAKVSVLSMI